jgi:cytoskeletal protein RodZ
MSPDTSDISTSPGLILKTAREELKLSIDQVAHELHLRSSVVHALEEERYDDFSSDVFLKGYFRSYCRLVNLHEERMVELLDAQFRTKKKEIEDVALIAKKAKKAKTRKKFAGVFTALALVAGLSFYVLGYLLPSEDSRSNQGMDAAAEKRNTALKTKDTEPEAENSVLTANANGNVAERDASEKQNAVPNDQNRSSSVSSMNAAETIENERKMTRNESAVPSRSGLSQDIEATQAESIAVLEYSSASFEAVFTGDCWFKFTNGKGKTVFAALKRAGQKVNYNGPTPFSVVLGDASQVNVFFEGKSVDLKPYTAKNGRAQISLETNN